jgi:serine/threonine protein kinase
MPDALCSRAKDVLPLTVNPGELPLYKAYLSEFVELNRSLQSLGSLPGIQRVADVFSENNTAYAIYDDVSGIPAHTYLANVGANLTHEQCKELFRVIFTALGRVNTAGIVHRGISPKTVYVQNVVHLGNTGVFGSNKIQPYIADFAITAARTAESKLTSEVYAGYAAPEQYNSTDRHGAWTDVYGLAALLYNAMTGVVPQDATERVKEDVLVEPAILNRNIPDSVSAAIMEALALSVDSRTKSVSELEKALGWHDGVKANTNTAPITYVNPNAALPQPAFGTSGAPVTPKIDIEFDADDDLGMTIQKGDFAGFASPNPPKTAKEQAKEDKRKLKMIAAFIAIGLIIVLFVVFLVLATFTDVFKREPSVTAGTGDASDTSPTDSSETSVPTSETEVSPPTTSGGEPVEMRAAPDFVRLGQGGRDNLRHDAATLNGGAFVLQFHGEFCRERVTRPFGTVIQQTPEPLTEIPVGSVIEIRYSLGREFHPIPAFAQGVESVEDYEQRLLEMGVLAGNILPFTDFVLPQYVEGADGTVYSVTSSDSDGIRIHEGYPRGSGAIPSRVTIVRAVNPERPPEPDPDPTTADPNPTPDPTHGND